MATTLEIDQALARLRSARVKLAQVADLRARAVQARDVATANVTLQTTRLTAARDEVNAARAAVQTLLAQQET